MSCRPRRRWWVLVAVVAVAVVVAVLSLTLPGRNTGPGAAPSSIPIPPGGRNVMILPLIPVGGQLPGGGTQTPAGARADVQAAADYGAAGVRVTADLSWLCSLDRRCYTSPLEPIVERARQLGLRVYLHVNSTPSWLDRRGTWYGPEGADAQVWAHLFTQFVQHFGTDVAGYEVWNEPNNPNAWNQGPEPGAYADLLKAVWTASKQVDPEAQLIGGVLSNNDLGYMHELDEALAARGGNHENRFFYDQLGVHPYAGEEGSGYDPKIPAGSHDVTTKFGVKDMTYRGVERLRDQVAEDEGIERDVVIGEFGYDTTPGNWYYVPEPRRATYMSNALKLAAAWPWATAFTYYSGEGFDIAGTPTETALRQTTEALQN